jgi:hypothetical protein
MKWSGSLSHLQFRILNCGREVVIAGLSFIAVSHERVFDSLVCFPDYLQLIFLPFTARSRSKVAKKK